jgi:hypothetical protein
MTRKPTKERPPEDDRVAAFRRFEKLTKALFSVDKAEYDRRRREYEQQKQEDKD